MVNLSLVSPPLTTSKTRGRKKVRYDYISMGLINLVRGGRNVSRKLLERKRKVQTK